MSDEFPEPKGGQQWEAMALLVPLLNKVNQWLADEHGADYRPYDSVMVAQLLAQALDEVEDQSVRTEHAVAFCRLLIPEELQMFHATEYGISAVDTSYCPTEENMPLMKHDEHERINRPCCVCNQTTLQDVIDEGVSRCQQCGTPSPFESEDS